MSNEQVVQVSVELVIDKLTQMSAEQNLKIATLQASNSTLHDKVSQLSRQLDDAQAMVDSLLKKNMELASKVAEKE